MTRTLVNATIYGMSTLAVLAFTQMAAAADLPSGISPPAYASPPIFTWTGFYIGGQLGYDWGVSSTATRDNWRESTFEQPNYNASGFVGGIHTGFNYQISRFVIGYEISTDGSTYHGSGLNDSDAISHSTRIPLESSYRGRVAIALDRALLFATGGLAVGKIENTSMNTSSGSIDRFDTTRAGWTIGGGIEYAITDNWSLRAEYRYADFGNISEFEEFSTKGRFTAIKHETDNKIEIGLSYKFDKSPLRMVADMLHQD